MHAPEEEFAAVLMPYRAPAEERSTSANPGNCGSRHRIEPNDVGDHSLLRTISGNADRECDASIIKKRDSILNGIRITKRGNTS